MKNWIAFIALLIFVGWVFYQISSCTDERQTERKEQRRLDSIERLDPEKHFVWNKEDVCLNAYVLNIDPDTAICIIKHYQMNTGLGLYLNTDSLLRVIFKKYPSIPKDKAASLILKCERRGE